MIKSLQSNKLLYFTILIYIIFSSFSYSIAAEDIWKKKENDSWELPSQTMSYNQNFKFVCKSVLSEIVNNKSLQEFNFRLAGHFINEKTVVFNYLCLSKKFGYSFIYNDK